MKTCTHIHYYAIIFLEATNSNEFINWLKKDMFFYFFSTLLKSWKIIKLKKINSETNYTFFCLLMILLIIIISIIIKVRLNYNIGPF